MSNHQPYPPHDDLTRPPKRPRPDTPQDTAQPYATPPSATPALHPDMEATAEAAAKKNNRKKPLSCGECRRLKLKCDRVFPCQSCCKRGCAEICPEGSLTGGKGSRFILANTEQLHEKIKAMSERIRTLEDALAQYHAQHSPGLHPLLSPDLLLIKRSPELFGVERGGLHPTAAMDNQMREDEEHPTASASPPGAEYTGECSYTHSLPAPGQHQLDIPEDITRLSHAFPVSPNTTCEFNPELRQKLRDMLPPHHEAQRICENVKLNAFWHYNPDASQSFIPNLLHSAYNADLPSLLPHRLSLFFMLLAIGTSVDLHAQQELAQERAEQYHQLARAAMCETMVIDDPSFDTINALFLMVWYLLMFSFDKKAIEHAWGLMGLLSKLAQSLSLHRDAVRSKMIPEELEKRQTLIWNIISVDIRLALMLRKPPSVHINHVDAKPPSYILAFDSPSTSVTDTYNSWRDAFTAQCMIPVLETVIATQQVPYNDILQLDWKIREFAIPPVLRMADDHGIAPRHPVGLQQGLTFLAREAAILNLHRSYCLQALNVDDGYSWKHIYAPSVLATYASACNVIAAVDTCYRWAPDLSVRITMLWSNVLSAAVAICVSITRMKDSTLIPHMFAQLERIVRLLSEVKAHSPSAGKAYSLMHTVLMRLRVALANHRDGRKMPDYHEDELLAIAQRTGIWVSVGGASMFVDGDASPFEHAHPLLRRSSELLAREGLSALAPLLQEPESPARTLQTFNMSAERTSESVSPVPTQPIIYQGRVGTEFQDSSWMTWY